MADGALLDAPVEVEQLVDIHRDALAEALAGRAHAVGMVERESVRPADERPAVTREEHPQVGVDLGDRADGAAAAGAEALLVDHDAGGDVPDGIDRGPGELGQPPAGVGAERLDELSLRLGADRVEHERRLAAAAHAGKGDEPMLRNLDVDALEVVRAGASDARPGYPRETERPSWAGQCGRRRRTGRAFRRATTRVSRKARLAHAATVGTIGGGCCARRAWRRRSRARGPRPDGR